MNYYYPAQLKAGPNASKWHYVCSNKRVGTYAVGYCAEGCAGHNTADEAREHYRQYQLDKCLLFVNPPDHPDTLYKCMAPDGCCTFTAGRAEIGAYLSWVLCDTHRNRETVEKLYPSAGDSWES